MSFSKKIKEELSKMNNLSNKDAVRMELIGYFITNNISIKNNKIKYSTESEYNINRFAKLLNNVNISKYKIDIQGRVFSITIEEKLKFAKELNFSDSIIRLNDNVDTQKAVDTLKNSVDPNRWICVVPDSVIIDSNQNVIIVIMDEKNNADTIHNNFKNIK